MKKFLIALLSLSFHIPAIAAWEVKEKIDSMTDEVMKSAYVVNEQGHSFTIYRIVKDGSVWGNFALSEKIFDQVDFRKPPIYRVDKNEPIDLSSKKEMQDLGLGIQAYEWTPKWVNFKMWHGKYDEGISYSLKSIMIGKNIVFRYFLGTGGYKETSFSLEGAKESITSTLGITYEPIKEDIVKDRIDSKLLSYHRKCRKNNKGYDESQKCIGRAVDCRDKAIKALDISVFNKCMN